MQGGGGCGEGKGEGEGEGPRRRETRKDKKVVEDQGVIEGKKRHDGG